MNGRIGNIEDVLCQFLRALPTSAQSRVLSQIESHPVPLHSGPDRRKGGQFGAKLKKLQPYGHRLPCGSVYRQAFLWGVANYLRDLPHEELVVGFGVAQDTRTRIDSVMKIRGEADHVGLPPDGAAAIHDFLNEDERRTAIFVHNHPEGHPMIWLLGLVFGIDPLPSLADRDFGADTLFRRLQSRLGGLAFGRIRFYVVQDDAVSEFSGVTPALFLDVVRRWVSAQGAITGCRKNG
jgi:hypothetical protein